MKRIRTSRTDIAAILLLMAGSFFLPGKMISATAPRNAPPGVILVSCDRTGAVIEVNLPDVRTARAARDIQNFTEVSIQGWCSIYMEEGVPALPQGGILIAAPPGSRAALSVEVLESSAVPLAYPPLPCPTIQTDLSGQNIQEVLIPDAATYASPAPFPKDWATLGEPVWQRTYSAMPLRINPVRYWGTKKELSIAHKMRIRVSFQGGREGRFISDPEGDALAKATILNYSQARGWQEKSGGPPPQISQTDGKYKVLVDRDGIYKIAYDDLTALGINPLEIDPQTLKLSVKVEQGAQDTISQVPIWVAGQNELDGEFDPDDYLLFFGKAPRGSFTYGSPYTLNNVYWLDWDGVPGLRLGNRVVTPTGSAISAEKFKASTRAEVDSMYEKFGFAPLTDDIDHWMWFRLDDNFDPEFSTLLSLPEHVAPPAGPAYNHYDFTASLRGYTYDDTTAPDHRAYGYWNSTSSDPIFDVLFEDQDSVIVSNQIPAASISAFNELILQAPEVPPFFANAFYLDWIKIDYWRSYRALNDTLLFQKPQNLAPQNVLYTLTGLLSDSVELWDISSGTRLTGYSRAQDTLKFRDFSANTTYYYAAGQSGWMTPQIQVEYPSSWKSPANGADYIMITHEDFYDALDPLVDHYINRGMRVCRVKVGDIYDEFNFGMKDPQALYDFLQYAFYNYQSPPPAYVLLVGDASWDYRNYDNLPYQDFVPTHHSMSYKWGETASDNYFAAVSGVDPLPDYNIGRMPADSLEEINTLVQKTLAYAQAPPGYWRSRIILTNGAAVDTIDAPYIDSTAQMLLDNYFPAWYNPPRVYLRPAPGDSQYYGDSDSLIGYWNEGAACVNYIGHAGNQMWETLNQSEINQLSNGSELPFVGSYSCFTGIFSNTTGFGEAMILHPGGGAVAYWSNSGIGYTQSNRDINNFLFEELFDQDAETIGQAVTQAKWLYYGAKGNNGFVLTTFVLLGDPGSYFVFSDPDPRDTLDNTPPEISFSVGDSLAGGNFENGSFIDNPVKIYANIFDSTGVAVYSISLHLTQLSGAGDLLDTTYYMPQDSAAAEISLSYNPPDSTGQHILLSYADSLNDGEWQLAVSASDSFDQGPTVDMVTFKISGGELQFVGAPLNYPNPFAEQTSFAFELTEPADVTIKIFTVAGKLIQVLQKNADAGYTLVEWDGRDAEGDPISNGAYLYKVIARSGDKQVEKIEKLARIR